MAIKSEYKAEDIKVLTFPDVIRKRPRMYAGETDNNDAVVNIFSMVLDYAVYLAGKSFEKLIKISSIYPEIEIHYSGEGFPFDRHFRDSVSHGERYLELFHSGPEEDKWTTPKDPLGLCVPNALSESFKVRSWENGRLWVCEYEKGIQTVKPHVVDKGKDSGTTFCFTPDATILKNYCNLEDRFLAAVVEEAKNNPEINFEHQGKALA